ncbi:MAG TPA: T9SS type A sorting domain-containing protein [Candidatus Kapabacteria bacterium]|nr:T9SS type A sorting domain-containing protein [Candidatus Kapabacteria bacterium]
MNNRTTRGLAGVVLCAMTVIAAMELKAQCPPDAEYPYQFCKDGKEIVVRCAPDPYHVWEDGQQLVPLKRSYPGCMTIEQEGRLDIYMPKVVTGGGPDDYVPVFLLANQERDIVEGFNDWNSICPPTDGDFDCCMKIYFSEDARDFQSPDQPVNVTLQVNNHTCRPTCDDDHRIYVNDSPEWLYKKPRPDPGDEIIRAFFTGRYPPSIAPYYEAYSLYQAILFGVGFWYGLPSTPNGTPGCASLGSVMANPQEAGPPTGITADDICQFKKLYCDHEVGLGVPERPVPRISFDVAPNPASNTIRLLLPEDHPHDPLMLRVVDAAGATVRELPCAGAAREIAVNLSDLASGAYMITLSNGMYSHGEKVIVRH